ncbi:MAG: hypothetical protein R3258_00040 [Acidimicrobiia bacterium]|nr:hypothetical protein [Acidimicrobiia bacterium]
MRLLRVLAATAVLVSSCTVTVDTPSPTVPAPATTNTTPTTTTVSVEMALAEFESCLEDAGLRIEPIPLDARGAPRFDLVMPEIDFGDASQVKALSECANLLSDGAIAIAVDTELQTLVLASLLDFAECVRDHGVEGFPDPRSDFTGFGDPFPRESIPFDDPGLEAATRLCAERLASP